MSATTATPHLVRLQALGLKVGTQGGTFGVFGRRDTPASSIAWAQKHIMGISIEAVAERIATAALAEARGGAA